MKYPHAVKIERVTYASDGAGGETEDSRSILYEGKADVQDASELKKVRDAGLEGKTYAKVFLPETDALRGAEKGDPLTWKDHGIEGIIYETAFLDSKLVAAF